MWIILLDKSGSMGDPFEGEKAQVCGSRKSKIDILIQVTSATHQISTE